MVFIEHYDDVIMGAIASQITSFTSVYSTVYSGADQRKYQISASLAFVRVIHRGPVNSPHKGPVTRKMFPFDDVIMNNHTSSEKQLPLRFSEWRVTMISSGNYKKCASPPFLSVCFLCEILMRL